MCLVYKPASENKILAVADHLADPVHVCFFPGFANESRTGAEIAMPVLTTRFRKILLHRVQRALFLGKRLDGEMILGGRAFWQFVA
jgi:hypothetical protein